MTIYTFLTRIVCTLFDINCINFPYASYAATIESEFPITVLEIGKREYGKRGSNLEIKRERLIIYTVYPWNICKIPTTKFPLYVRLDCAITKCSVLY